MFSKIYKYIGIFIIALVLLGHHSFQAQAMGDMHHHEVQDDCTSTDCHHQVNMEICKKIQADEMQASSQFFTLPKISDFVAVELQEGFTSFKTFEHSSERIPLSYQQLARSHLS
jgi:hypothetical protein